MKKILLSFLGFIIISLNCTAADEISKLILFYGETCPHCKAEEGYLETLKEIYDFEVVGYEVYYDKGNQEIMKEYGEHFGTEFNGVPVVIMEDEYFMGANYDKTVALLEKYALKKGDEECLPENDKIQENTNPIVDCTDDTNSGENQTGQNITILPEIITGGENTEIITGKVETGTLIETGNANPNDIENQTTTLFGKEISLEKTGPVLFGIVLGFADGINPCMFGVLIFLLTYLVSIGSRKKVLYSGIIFVVTTFFMYAIIMYGMHKLIFSTQVLLPYIATIKYIIGAIAIILGLLEIKDFFRYGKGVSLAIPKWAKPTLEYITKKGTYMSAFILAVLSTLVELPCTIGIPLAYIGAVGTKINLFASLGIYNFFFVLPLIIIILGIYYGSDFFENDDKDLALNSLSNKKVMRLFAGIILITLGILFLTKVL